MRRMRKSLIDLNPGEVGIIISLKGGHGFTRRLGTRGIQVGKRIRMITKQFGGPVVVEVSNCQMTMGRGMARRVIVEVVQ